MDKTIKDILGWYNSIVNLYESCDTDEAFTKAYKHFLEKYKDTTVEELDKIKITNINNLKVVIKAKYCIEIPDITIQTIFNNAHYIAGNISKEILLGIFSRRSLSTKQKNMFEKSMGVDFSNLDRFDLREIAEPSFVKNPNLTF